MVDAPSPPSAALAMMSRAFSWSDDLSLAAIAAVVAIASLSLLLLALEFRRRERYGALIAISGIMATLLAAMAVLRPVQVTTRGNTVGPRVVVLVDRSRRLLLPGEGEATRRRVAAKAIEQLRRHFADARLSVLGFGDGAPVPLDEGTRLTNDSDLAAAVTSLASSAGERARAVVVISDGRLSRPGEAPDAAGVKRTLGQLEAPIHTVSVAERAPRDASIRAVRAAGAAVAHQPLAVTVQVGCSGGLPCEKIPVVIQELRQGAGPAVLASGVAEIKGNSGTIELEITLERAGSRVVQVQIQSPEGDEIADNDRRILPFDVARERIRLLHVAGRPTYDVRALRMWLKSDESVDLVAFFILRTESDDTQTDEDSELALIPFPVDELFTQHLPSFDAIVLQDIDAVRYQLAQHLPALARYVESGGGLIMVGGPAAFAGGGYADTAIDRVMPVEIPQTARPFDTVEFTPRYTDAGRAAPVLRPLRDLFADELPLIEGSNTLGAARPNSIVLWEHPSRTIRDEAGGAPMPLLALAEFGDGRSVALGVDGTYALAFGDMASKVGGRSYGALWDGLLGWLMRDPRYEAARIELITDCIAGEPTKLRVVRLPGAPADVELTLERLGVEVSQPLRRTAKGVADTTVEIDVGPLETGGYSARARIGAAPPTRFDFACERGGEAWSDSRPDPERLRRISDATAGQHVSAADVKSLPSPEAVRVAAERHVSPLLPPWAWALASATALGVHWVARRRGGLP
jgi:uncharacterized membrane protein